MNAEILATSTADLVEPQVQKINAFLTSLGLPAQGIIADVSERNAINNNLLDLIAAIPSDLKRDARYLSKFVIGAGFGLFDYALNSLWNEVVLTLHRKVINYGVDIFYDAAVGPKIREAYKDEGDLAGLKDAVLLDTCKKLELIGETTFKKLHHILDMRNNIGISHPTDATINAYELMGWLQTCVKEVISDVPSPAAIHVQSLIQNLKSRTDVVDSPWLSTIKPKLRELASYHCGNILRTLFGLYVADDTTPITRKNISLIAPDLWELAGDEVKFKLGITLEGYNNNLHTDKYDRGAEFFGVCNGNAYRTTSEKLIAIDDLNNKLSTANSGWDNFYHEVPHIVDLMSYIHKADDIPEQISPSLIHTILLCRIGRGVNLNHGVSPRGKAYYDKFFIIMGEKYFPQFIAQLTGYDIQVRLSNGIRKAQMIEILTSIRSILITDRFLETIDYIINNLPTNYRCTTTEEFKKITSSFLNWK